MHTVCETQSFRRAAQQAGMSEEEIGDLVTFLAENPSAGDEIVGTGGCRKVRLAGRGKGKSGGYRTITFYTGINLPVYLVTVFSKGEKSDLNQREKQALKELTEQIVKAYNAKVTKVVGRQ